MTIDVARARCRAANTDLATIADAHTNQQLTALANSGNVVGIPSNQKHRWIGLSRQNNQWVWDNGEAFNYQAQWVDSEEAVQRGRVALHSDGRWYGAGEVQYGFFCQSR